MSFIDWKDVFDEIFEGLSDSWSFTLVSRGNQFRLTKLENERYKLERNGYAKYADIVRFLFNLIFFFLNLDFFVQNVQILGHPQKPQ